MSLLLMLWHTGLIDDEVLEYLAICRELGRPLPTYTPRNETPWHARTTTDSSAPAYSEFYY